MRKLNIAYKVKRINSKRGNNKSSFNSFFKFFKNDSEYNNDYYFDGDDYTYNPYSNNWYDGFNGDINNFDNNMVPQSVNPKNKNKKKFWFFSIIIGSACFCIAGISFLVFSLTASQNSAIGGNSSNSSSRYNTSSATTNWISERTLSLRFSFTVNGDKSYYEYGTGWVYYADQNTNTFYIATNLHVAGIVSLNNKDVYKSNETTAHYSNLQSWVGFAQNITGSEINSANIPYYSVSNPEIVYTTVLDSAFTNTFNSTSNQYYATLNGVNEGFDGISDIAILKYTLNPEYYTTQVDFANYKNYGISTPNTVTAITNFKNWITTYFANPTKVYKENMEKLSFNNLKNLSMAGYPSYNIRTGTKDENGAISWLPFSNFSVVQTYSPITQNGLLVNSSTSTEGKEFSSPIQYLPSTIQTSTSVKDNYYTSIGLLSELSADSYEGASGSPIVANLGTESNPDYYVVGIYWGAITYQYANGSTKAFGTMTWFATNNTYTPSHNYSYNLTTGIDSKIGISTSTNS